MRKFDPDKIRERRRSLHLTQAQLAGLAATAREYIVEIEKGRKMPRANFLSKLATALRVKESYFFIDTVS